MKKYKQTAKKVINSAKKGYNWLNNSQFVKNVQKSNKGSSDYNFGIGEDFFGTEKKKKSFGSDFFGGM
jgi:hypothetical protein